MPRISRHQVEFESDGLTFVADFRHQHVRRLPVKRTWQTSPDTTVTAVTMVEDPKGLPNMVAMIGNRTMLQKIRHITRCTLYLKGKEESIWGEGKAKCSMSDTYNWRIGIDLAFRRALADSIPDMPDVMNQMVRAFYFHLGIRRHEDTVPAGKRMTVIGRLGAPPVTPPGRSLPALTGMVNTPFELDGPVVHGFGLVRRNGVNLMLPMANLREIDPRALPSNGDDILEATLLSSEEIPVGGA